MSVRKRMFVKIVVYTPLTHADIIRETLNLYSGSKMGKYDFCSFGVVGIGRYRPLKGAKPFLGKLNALEMVKEERIETILEVKDVSKILQAIKKVHPYEEPAIDIYPLLYPS